MTDRWYPHGTETKYGPPPVGRLIAFEHTVWRITAVTDLPLSDADRDVWLDAGMPDQASWKGRPCRVDVEYIGGVRPKWAKPGDANPTGHTTTPAVRGWSGHRWYLYPVSGRWPQCSCCGEPMPCRAELQDREVTDSLKQVEKFAARLPGCCWGCNEPITSRQKAVTYSGDNLDLPGGMEVRFHARAKCRYAAQQYELRWIAVDPRRERILTWPKCGGILVVHADGSSECRSGLGPLGEVKSSEPDCRGHLTHDHDTHAACFVGDGWFERGGGTKTCPRGCSRAGHPGAGPPRRPNRRQNSLN